MRNNNFPRLSKTKNRTIRLKLPVDLLDAIAEMGRDASRTDMGAARDLKNMIECSLLWAVWAYSRGRGPDAEMLAQPHGYSECEPILRARRERSEVAYLEQLYRLEEKSQKAFSEPRSKGQT